MFKKVLIANRGEIALRIHRACREMGIETVAVHSTADADAKHVRLASESVCIGPASSTESYLNIAAIVSAAEISGADAIHPGYGFLSENADFARIVKEHGITFIGPEAEHIDQMGDKIAAKETMKRLGVPVTPGGDGELESEDAARKTADEIGYPVLIKAASGGGGRGMKIVEAPEMLAEQYHAARNEARAAFGDDTVYMEKFLSRPRHIEMQIIADSHGNVVHLGERDCSLQRRHQKVLEEAPSPIIDSAAREKLGKQVTEAIKSMGYLGVGTIEFLYENGEFYFIEMNTRLQVEHPVTEMITGLDLVREQLLVAAGEKLAYSQEDITLTGHSMEFRINAEDPDSFAPMPGKIQEFHTPGGLGVRVDSGLYTGYTVPPWYDSLIAKLIVYGRDRDECIRRSQRALEEFVITGKGVKSTIPLHQRLLENETFQSGDYDIRWLEEYMGLK